MNSKRARRKQASLVLCVFVLGYSMSTWPQNETVPAVLGTENGDAARLDVEQTVADLGPRLCYKPISHIFPLANRGREALTLKVEKKSCGCTTELLSGEAIEPSGSGQITISYTPKADRPRLGKQTFTVELSTNDPRQARVVFTVKVELVEPVHPSPATLDFGEISSKTTQTKPLEIICYRDDVMPEILSIEASSESLAVRPLAEDRGEGERRHRYEVALDPSQIAGEYRAHLLVKTDSARIPALEIPVKALVPLPLQATPRKILFGIIRPNTEVAKSVVLSAANGDVVPDRLTCSDGRISAKFEPMPEGNCWKLNTRLTAGAVVGAAEKLRASVELFDAGGVKVAEVPVVAVIAPGNVPHTDKTEAGRQ